MARAKTNQAKVVEIFATAPDAKALLDLAQALVKARFKVTSIKPGKAVVKATAPAAPAAS
jgi:hypothetical protein